jgi:ribosomal protein S18 acetylase RimI-like enzyme
MAVLHAIRPQIASNYSEVRLRALRDSPSAFGSTYLRESHFSAEDWSRRAANLCTDRSVGYLAFDNGQYCGIAVSFLDEHDLATAQLLSMWVAPEYRRAGVGKVLVDAIAAWAAGRGARTLRLMVTSNNDSAMAFYRRNGFSPTGHTEPYPNDSALTEYEMSKLIL